MVRLNNEERNHILRVLYLFFSGIFNKAIFFILGFKFIVPELGISLTLLLVSLGIILLIIYYFIDWHKTIFIVKESSIYYQTGIFNIQKREISFDKIHTVDITYGILDRIFNVAKIKIDTGTNKSGESELDLLLKKEKAFTFKNRMLMNDIKNEEKEENKKDLISYGIGATGLLKYALTSNVIVNGIGIIFIIYNVLDDYVRGIFGIKIYDYIPLSFDTSLVGFIFMAGIVLLFSMALSIVNTFLKYYDFKVFIEDGKINVKYGLLNNKSYSFAIKKIKGVHIKQNIFMQLLNLRTIEIEGIGYGDEKGEKAIIYPICNQKLQNDLLNNLLKEFIFTGEIIKAPRISMIRFMFKKLVISMILIISLMYYFTYGYLSFILIPFVVLLGYLQYRNTSLGTDNTLFYLSYNGFYKNTSIIKKSAVQSLEISYSYLQKRKGLCNYAINIFSNQFGKKIKVKNMFNKIITDKVFD